VNKGFIFGFVTALIVVVVIGGAFMLGRGSANKEDNKATVAQNDADVKKDDANVKNASDKNASDSNEAADNAGKSVDNAGDSADNSADSGEEFKPDGVEQVVEGVNVSNVQEWDEGDLHCYNYTVQITNFNDEKADDWTFDLEVPEGSELSQYWECEMVLKDNMITVKPVDYNKEVEAGATVSFGFIIKTKVKYDWKKADMRLGI
jgi:hypothetical protein